MKDSNIFNIDTADLSSNMILEASAGTGKTYSLEHLFIRYILESGISVKEILVVTFTEKAASELKKRIKALLVKELSESLSGIENMPGRASDTLSIKSNTILFSGNQKSSHRDKYHILKNALYEFSEVPIFTIHGFCQHCLSAFPVESGLPFDFKIMESDSVYRETVLDYYRSLDTKGDDEYLSFRNSKPGFDACVEYFVSMLKNFDQAVCIHPDADHLKVYNKMKNDFYSGTGEIRKNLKLLQDLDPDLELLSSINKKMKLKIGQKYQPMIIDLIKDLFEAETISDFFNDNLVYHYGRISKLTLSMLELNEKDITILDERETDFISILDSLLLLPDGFCFDEGKGKKGEFPYYSFASASFILRSFNILKENLSLKKMKNSELDFSDLINFTYSAIKNIQDSRGRDFKNDIKRKYKIVMIDEFQDTDNLQWEIFSSLFTDSDRKIVLIGDPKQSIYRFRGADIEVYFRALEEIKESSTHYILETNYRSEKRLVSALNILFKKVFAKTAGGGHSINFSPVKSIEDKTILLEKGGIEFLAVDNESKLKSDDVQSVLQQLFAREIINLLKSGSVNASDICILLESNEKCRNMYKALVSLDIPAVYEGDIDLFESDEIHTALDFLAAISSPYDRGRIIKILISPLFDFQLSDLPPRDDDYTYEKISSVFYKWKDLTDRGEFATVYSELTGSARLFPEYYDIDSQPYLIRRISEIGGERKITNFDHICEILINRNHSKKESSTELFAYLISVMEGAEQEKEKLSRLERDDKSVRIMTIHKSKGLEFPVVFFGGGMSGDNLPTKKENYYEYVKNGERHIDLVKHSRNKTKHYYEQWEERKRLYYVAFTRAEQKLYLPLFKYSNLNYLSSIYGSIVFDELYITLKEKGIQPIVPFAVMNTPPKMTKEKLSEIISEKIYELIIDKFNKSSFFNVNTDLYQSVITNTMQPNLERMSESSSSDHKNKAFVFKEASGDYNNKNISIVSYSSIVRLDDYNSNRSSAGINKIILLGEKSPGDEENTFSSLVTVGPELTKSNSSDFLADSINREIDAVGKDANREDNSDDKDVLKGPVFGNLMHTLLEKSDYSKILGFENAEEMREDDDLNGFIENICRQFLPHDRIKLSLSLVTELLYQSIHGRFSLPDEKGTLLVGELSEEDRRHELEFILKVKKGKSKNLLNLPSLHLESGYIKGFIDLIFIHDNQYYIADWKTNYLGNDKDNYRGENLADAMAEHNYYLQMKLYMTALSRIISVREGISLHAAVKKVGGAYYFFLRGLDKLNPESGVYFAPPDENEIIKFSETFFEGTI